MTCNDGITPTPEASSVLRAGSVTRISVQVFVVLNAHFFNPSPRRFEHRNLDVIQLQRFTRFWNTTQLTHN